MKFRPKGFEGKPKQNGEDDRAGLSVQKPLKNPMIGQDPSFIDFLGFPYVEFMEGFFFLI